MTFDSTGSGDSDRSMETDSSGRRTETYSSWLLEAVAPPPAPPPAQFRGVYDEAHPRVPVQVYAPPTGVPLGLILSGVVVAAVGVGIWAISTGRIDLGTTREILGLAPVERAAATATPTEATTHVPSAGTSSAATPKRAGGASGSSRTSAGVPAVGAASVANAAVADASTRAAIGPAGDPVAQSSAERMETIRVHVTYDASDTAVIPPLIDMPEISARDRIRPVTSGAPAIEIVINERGTVDSARATVQPKTVGEASLLMGRLSAVKAWRFQPATKNGEAVRYRLLVPFDVD